MRWLIDPVFNAVPALEFLQFLPEKIPYELIGRLIVLIALVITVVFGVGIVFGVTAYVWMKFWFAISNLMWRGYEQKANHPPVWKTRISGIALCIQTLKLWKIPTSWKNAKEMSNTKQWCEDHGYEYKGDEDTSAD
jgi:hypothetical protein